MGVSILPAGLADSLEESDFTSIQQRLGERARESAAHAPAAVSGKWAANSGVGPS